AAIARQRHLALGLVVGGPRLGELARDAANLHHRLRTGKGQNHRHLEENAEEDADVVRAMFREAFGAVAALKEKCVTGSHAGKLLLQLARLTCKNERRKAGELGLDSPEGVNVRISRDLLDRLFSPGIRGPLRHCRNHSLLGAHGPSLPYISIGNAAPYMKRQFSASPQFTLRPSA